MFSVEISLYFLIFSFQSEIDPELLSSVSTIIDGQQTPGGKSTVIDVDESTILRKGSHYEEIKTWVEDNSSFPLE